MDQPQKDLEEVLGEYECPFTWGLEEFEESFASPILHVDDYIRRYNTYEKRNDRRKFRTCLYLSYIMYRHGLDGWDKMLENTFRIMENSRGADGPNELEKLPNYDIHLYSGPTREFFLQDGDSTTSSICKEDADHDSSSDADDDDGESLEGLYKGAKHTFYSLKATIMYHVGSSPSDVQELLSHAVHMDDMTPGDKAAVLLFKATTIRNCGDRGLDMAMDILKKAILIDPDNLSWPLMLIIYSGEKRRSMWGKKVDESEVLSIIQVIDSVLQHDIKPWMRVRYQFDKLQALNEMCKNDKHGMSAQERNRMYQTCAELAEELARTTNKPNILAYCAQYISANFRKIQQAIQLVEMALETKPDDVYVNAKACNIYKKAGELEKALECAEKAASTNGYGSVWQIVELRLALNHTFDYEEYFCGIIKKFSEDAHVKCTHKNAALFYVAQGDFKHALEHFKALLDVCDPDDYILGELYWGLNGKMVDTVEAAYNVALYVMSSEYEHENEGLESLCNTIREKIEEVFDVNDFKSTGRSTSKQYVEWLRQKQTRMGRSRDDGPCVTNESRMSNYRSDRCAGDEQSRDRVSTYQNRSVTSEFRDGRVSDVKNHIVGFGSDSRRNTVSDEHKDSPGWSYDRDRYSENGGTSARRAQHMSNYFGKFEGATGNTSVDFPKPRTTQPQSDDMYHGYNQQNNSYKPSISENWRSRDGTNGGTPRNTSTQTSSRRPADLSRNWRERD